MTPRRRLLVAISITAVAFAAMVAAIAIRLHHWDQIGWAGLNYLPVFSKRSSESPAMSAFGIRSGRVIVVYPNAPASRGGIDNSDVVESINGVPITDQKAIDRLDHSLKRGDRVTYRLSREKVARDVTVRLESPLRGPRMLASMALSILLAASFTLIGLAVFVRRPDDRRAFVFYVMAVVGALSFLGAIAISIDGSNLRGISITPGGSPLVIFAYMAASFAFGALTLHLSLIFPHDRKIVVEQPWIVRWVYTLPAFAGAYIGCALALSTFANTRAEKTIDYALGQGFRFIAAALSIAGALAALRIARKARTEGFRRAFETRAIQSALAIYSIAALVALILDLAGLRGASRAVFFLAGAVPALGIIAYPILTFIALYRSYREANVEEKRQVKWPLWGTMIALGVKVLFGMSGFIVSIFVGARMIDATRWVGVAQTLELIPRTLYLLIPISFAVAILKYRLMNIDVIIKKTVAYTILSGLIIAIYLVLVGGLGTVLVNAAGVRNQTMVIMSTLVVALLFVPLRNRLQHLVDRNLFRQKYDYPQALRAIASETMAATELRDFLTFAAETLQQALQNRSVVIFERRQDDLVSSAKVGLPDTILGSLRMDAQSAGSIDRALNPRRRQLPEEVAAALRRAETALAVPVRSQGVLHGVLALGAKLSDREFDLEDLEFISSASDQIAITIDRIRLRRDEEDFEQARAIQQSLLPSAMPHVEGVDVSGTWKPARAVSGDYYDLLRLSDTQLAVCIGDVAGKGMPAALLMSALQAAVRASASPDVSASDLCERVRRVIVQSLTGGRFVTFFYCTIDTQARRIRYCNAGHNPPVLVRADSQAIRLDRGGPAISRLFSGTPFTTGEEELLEGDRLVLFTDGVSESRDAAGNDFGEERLEQLIAANRKSAARDLIATIVNTVSSFSGGRAEDDLTLVAVAVTQPA